MATKAAGRIGADRYDIIRAETFQVGTYKVCQHGMVGGGDGEE
jgi:hypothetical protein